MTSAEVVLHEGLTASEAMSHLRTIRPDSDAVSYLFVVNDEMCLVGGLSLRQLVLASPSAQIGEIMEAGVKSVQPDTDQEEAARLLARYDILLLPVIDDNGHLLGIITHDDMVEVIEEEATEDILRLGGIPMKEESEVRILPSLRNRLPWLLLNLATAMASAVVLGLFKNTIAQVAILVAFFPLVAGRDADPHSHCPQVGVGRTKAEGWSSSLVQGNDHWPIQWSSLRNSRCHNCTGLARQSNAWYGRWISNLSQLVHCCHCRGVVSFRNAVPAN
jgi:hypothetical protein